MFHRKNKELIVSYILLQSQDGVLMVLPGWGAGYGGLCSLAHKLIKQLKGRPVTCVLGTPGMTMSSADLLDIKQQGVHVLYPHVEHESNLECLNDSSLFDHLYGYITPALANYGHILSFGKTTYDLAKYFAQSSFGKHCKLVIFHCDTYSSTVPVINDVAIGNTTCFSVGYSTFRFMNTEIRAWCNSPSGEHSLLLPDYSDLLTDVSDDFTSANTRSILIPWNEHLGEDFEVFCAHAVNECSQLIESLNLRLDIVIQRQKSTHPEQRHLYSHTKCHAHEFESTQAVIYAARQSQIVIANGHISETGFSGLEFLMNGIVTFVPDKSDVAELLQRVSPVFADVFLFNVEESAFPQASSQTTGSLVKKIIYATTSKSVLLEKTAILVKELRSHAAFTDGNKRISEVFHCML
jgi:hypothetical protein